MNKGLKKYTKQISQTIGNAGSASVNLNENDANMHIVLPLLSTKGLDTFETSLIFNLQNANEDGIFGKGFKLNYYSKISDDQTNVFITNADGSTDEYLNAKKLKNEETNMTVKRVYSSDYATSVNKYVVTDKYGNEYEYSPSSDYPTKMKSKSGSTITTDFISAVKKISNGKGDEITFSREGTPYIERIDYLYDNYELTTIFLSYTDGYLSNLQYYLGHSLVGETSLSIKSNEIIICDEISKYRIKYTVKNGKIVSIKDGYDENFTNGNIIGISYEKNKTVLMDKKGKKYFVYFDCDGFATLELDNDGNAVKTEYDRKTKEITNQSSVIYADDKDKNLLSSNNIDCFDLGDAECYHNSCSDPIVEKAIGTDTFDIYHEGEKRQTITKEISVKGIAGDKITAVVWGKFYKPCDESNYVEVKLYAGGRKTIYKKFYKPVVDSNYDMLVLGINAEKSYEYIAMEITLVGTVSVELGGIQILKKDFGAFYNYDDDGNVTDSGNGGLTNSFNYGTNNLPTSMLGADSSKYDYKYDDKNNITSVKTAYGVQMNNKYDAEEASLITEKEIVTEDGECLSTKQEYTADKRFISKEVDELGNETTYTYLDALGKVEKVVNALGIATNYTYYDNGFLKAIKMLNDNNEISGASHYTYDAHNRLTKIRVANMCVYEFTYDNYNNITKVIMNSNVLCSYSYDNKQRLIELKYGEKGDAYLFVYNNDNNIVKVRYADATGVVTDRFNYEYDSRKRLVKVTDQNQQIINKYEYDDDGNIKAVLTPNSKIEDRIDNLGNIIFKNSTVDGKSIKSSYDSVVRSKGSHPDAFFASYQNGTNYIATFEDDECLRGNGKIIKPYQFCTKPQDYLKRDGLVRYMEVNNENMLEYITFDESFHPLESGCIQFWFKPAKDLSKEKKFYLFYAAGNKSHIGVFLENEKVKLELVDNDENTINTDLECTIDLNKWNFVALDFMNRNDEGADHDVCEYSLTVNGTTQVYKKANPSHQVSIIYPIENCSYPNYCIGHGLDSKLNPANQFHGGIALLCIAPRLYLPLDEVKMYYRTSKDYLVDNALIDDNLKTVDFSQTTLYDIDEDLQEKFNIVPLQNSVVSLKNKKPIRFDIRQVSNIDKDRTFNFNKKIKRYAYVADGTDLAYNFDLEENGTIMMRAYTDVITEKQYLFDCTASIIGSYIALYRDKNENLHVNYLSNDIDTGMKFTTNEWHTVALSFEIKDETQSTPWAPAFYYRIYLDGQTFNGSFSRGYCYGSYTVNIGRKEKEETCPHNLGENNNVYPLHGQIEMLAVSNSYCELTTIERLKEQLKGTTRLHEFDVLGMLKKTEVHKCGQSILSNSFEYKKGVDEKHISNRVEKETIRVNGNILTTRTYETDALGNITKITDDLFGSHSYTYNERGFLTKADKFSYEYDKNGNITKYGNYTYSYDSKVKDLLKSFNGIPLSYCTESPFTLKSCGDYVFEFDGRRLIKMSASANNIEYKYNAEGMRIEKVIDGETTKYTYDKDRLINQISGDERFDFLYDENGELYGFIENSEHKYFYVRDYLKNILGIVDINGNLVVTYKYDAYGRCALVKGDAVGKRNPFRFKGYYYDTESGMYYCGSRYYIPILCRWLTMDSPSFLDPKDINSLNLFAYCANDPVNKIDDNGKFPILLTAILVIATIGGALIGGLKAHKDAEKEGKTGGQLVWDTIKGTLIGASLGLAAGGFVVCGISGFAAIGAFSVYETTVLGLAISKAFAIGALAVDVAAFAILPLFCIEMEGIEIGDSSGSAPNPNEVPPYSQPWNHSKRINRIELNF